MMNIERLTGTIWTYDQVTEDGYIFGQDNQKYRFSRKDYSGSQELAEGDTVVFKAAGRWANEITLLAANSFSPNK